MNSIPKKSFAFVVMPFSPSLDSVYQLIVKPAVESCGIKCLRADEESQGHIHSQMLQRIYQSAVIVADITGLNANVFYELGVAHSSGCKTVVICDRSKLATVPFDISSYRVFDYQHPDQEDDVSVDEVVKKLAEQIRRIVGDQSEGIPNPVQDYLASQSPFRSSNSLFVNELGAKSEEELFEVAEREVVYYAITANFLSDMLTGLVESRKIGQLVVHLCLLDPEAHDCWDFLYRMKEGRPMEPSLFKEYLEEDVSTQTRAVQRLKSLTNRKEGFVVRVHFYSNPPLFWAYLVDQARLIVGHLAMRRLNARNLPVSILVKADRSTQNLFAYYHSIVESAMGGGDTQQAAAADG